MNEKTSLAALLRSALLAAGFGLCLAAQAAAPLQFYTYDPATLALSKQKVAAHEGSAVR
ncbi:hypothetical protein [Massilia terrae]|uniref:Uncharacterized protein n=1 Tax=Massilia terrae TaxID=1811224 RepID=A0ABT2CUV8_9BURK|nr:hypothetical protein [Massilia terrae]MCS0657767.1 hypothetical protein [Massilia terrae]